MTLLRLTLALLVGLVAPLCLVNPVWAVANELSARDVEPPSSLRELYVPFAEFQRLQREHPKGVVMPLDEYRDLVADAVRNLPEAPAPLPPRDAVITSARYDAKLIGASRVECRARLQVTVKGSGWVRASLGKLPPIVDVAVDGEPGWLLRGNGEISLLLRGDGAHSVELVYHVAIADEGEQRVLRLPTVASTMARLNLEIPGLVDGEAPRGALTTATSAAPPLAPATRLTLDFEHSDVAELRWQRQQAQDANPVLLSVEHRFSLLPTPSNPRFAWQSSVDIARRAVDRLTLRIPPGFTVLGIDSPLLLRWERVDDRAVVLLKEATLGKLLLHVRGVVQVAPNASIVWTPPQLVGAFHDHGTLSVLEAKGATIVVNAEALEVLDPESSDVVTVAGVGRALQRFRFRSDEARAEVASAIEPLRFTARGSYLATLRPSQLGLMGFVHVEVREGRSYRFTIQVPEAWSGVRVQELVDRNAPASARQISTTERTTAGGTEITVTLARAATTGFPLRLRVTADGTAMTGARDWARRSLPLPLPHFLAADQATTDLAVLMHESVALESTQLEGWRTLPADERASLGFDDARFVGDAGSGTDRLVLSATTEQVPPTATLEVEHVEPRLEYRVVTHVLAAESTLGQESGRHALRVRADCEVAVVGRAIDELSFVHPSLPDGSTIVVQGPEIKETESLAVAGVQRIQFARPWLGLRQFRLEYEVTHTPGLPVELPEIAVRGNGLGEGFVVLQSQGSVEVEASPSANVTAIDFDELPDFAEGWADARVLRAYRQRTQGAIGTIATAIHDRAPVLQQLIRSLQLETLLSRDGSSRTRVELVLTYSRQQVLPVRLPRGTRCLGVEINDEPISAVRREPDGRLAIPLPPRSHATVAFVYERAPQFDGQAESGSWEQRAPEFGEIGFGEIPIAETTWRFYYPPDVHCQVLAGNLRPTAQSEPKHDRSFAEAVWGQLLRGRWPQISTFRSSQLAPVRAVSNPLSDSEKLGARSVARTSAQAGAAVSARLRREQSKAGEHAPLPRALLFAEGAMLETTKIGGNGQLVIGYRTLPWERTAKRFVFCATLCLALWLLLQRGKQGLRGLLIGGLFFGTLIPIALQSPSPLLLVPFCEALFLIAIGWIGWDLLRRARARLPFFKRAQTPLAKTAVWIFFASVLALPTHAGADPADPFAPVVVPYGEDGEPWRPEAGSPAPPVFLPESQFRALMALAEGRLPKPTDDSIPDGLQFVIGKARYDIDGTGDLAAVEARFDLYSFVDGWIELPLPFDRLQLIEVTVNGQAVGIAPSTGNKPPFLELRGKGRHQVRARLRADLIEQLGTTRLESRILSGGATCISVTLPAGAELDGGMVPVRTSPESDTATIEFSLPPGAPLALAWRLSKQSGSVGSQSETVSYTQVALTPSATRILRLDKLQFTGAPREQVVYEIGGDWEVHEVLGDAVSEWSVRRPEQNRRSLEVYFSRPVAAAELTIRGSEPYRLGAMTLPTLALVGANRAESYFGFVHGASRRFLTGNGLLQGFRQDSAARARDFGLPAADQLFHSYGSGSGAELAVELTPRAVALQTDAALLISKDRAEYFVRSTYNKVGSPVTRHVVELPQGWTVRSVQCQHLRSWRVVTDGAVASLVVEFVRQLPSDTVLLWTATAPRSGQTVAVPIPRASGVDNERFVWAVGAHKQLDVVANRTQGWDAVPRSQADSWMQPRTDESYRFAYRARRGAAALALRVQERASSIGSTVATFVRVSDDRVIVSATLFLRIGPGAREAIALSLPLGAELVSLETRQLASRRLRSVPGGAAVVDVTFQGPITGEHIVDVVYQYPRQAGAAANLTPIGVLDGDRGESTDAVHYVGVVQADRTVTLRTTATSLAPADPSAFPAWPSGVSRQSLSPTYVGTAADWELAIDEEWIEEADRLDALIQLADLSTVIGFDGTARTQVVYTLRNDRLQFLEVQLPPGTDLWGVTVGGRSVAVGGGQGGPLRIPVPRDPQVPVEVAISYAELPLELGGSADSKQLQAPRIPQEQAVQVVQSLWSVQYPDEYDVRETGKKMRPAPASLRSAERLKNLLRQQESVSKTAFESSSLKARNRAEQQLRRIDQELGDNLAQLRDQNRGAIDRKQQVDSTALEMQWAANDAIILQTETAQQRLRAELKRQDEAGAGAIPRDEELFQDRANFLRGQNAYRERPGGGRKPGRGAFAPRLLDGFAYPGWGAVTPPLAAADGVVRSERGQRIAQSGLRPLPPSSRPGLTPAVDPFSERPGQGIYTFRGDDGDAELTLRFRPPGRGVRQLSWLLLVVAAGVVFLAWRGRVRAARWKS